MRTGIAGLAVLSLAVAACGFSKVDPNAAVHIAGRALDSSGKPLAHAKVLLFKQADIGEVVFGTVLAVGTLGAACLVPHGPAICAKARTATTDADGRYSFDLQGSDTQGTLGTASTLNVVFTGKSAGTTTVSFTADKAAIKLPDARLWNADPRVSQSDRIRVSWSRLPAGAGSSTGYSAELFSQGAAAPLWSQSASGSGTSIDPRITEGEPGSVAAGAHSTLEGGSGTGTVHASYLSTRLQIRGTGDVPASRGRLCAPVTGTTPPRTGTYTHCAETDGDLETAAHLSGHGVVAGTVIDLGSRRPIDLVVARGFSGQFLVELSDDGRTWHPVATNSGTAAVTVPGRPTARYVRLRSPAGLDESLNSEVSVWS
ncbi:MAG TPA: discoidin domain-containing protein [Marmoricola sp.]|jgi:hypothetical protein|nr:discoidin domain-containing protein [Marmoricola sp.]